MRSQFRRHPALDAALWVAALGTGVIVVTLLLFFLEAPLWLYLAILLPPAIGCLAYFRILRFLNWEKQAVRRSVFLLQLAAFVAIGKATAGLTIAVVSASGSVTTTEHSSELEASLTAQFLSSGPLTDTLLLFAGAAITLATRVFLPPRITTDSPNVGTPHAAPRHSAAAWVESADYFSRSLAEIRPLTPGETKRALRFRGYNSDRPPASDVWVGRSVELGLLSDITKGVVGITGIGGQGKSTLAAKALEAWQARHPDQFWDWRDCREQRDSFEVQVSSLIHRLTEGRVGGRSTAGWNPLQLARLFCRLTQDTNGFLVFDNVDQYVNTDGRILTGAAHDFVTEVLRTQSNFIIIITCRPSVTYPDMYYKEIALPGISVSEALDLFSTRKVPSSIDSGHIEDIHYFTRGHPFWLSMIAAELFRRPGSRDQVLQQLREGQNSDDRVVAMFRPIWQSINSNQQSILQILSEVDRPFYKDRIRSMLIDRIRSDNQFERAFRANLALSLITTKRSPGQSELFEVHPLVRQFVRTELPRDSRRPFIRLHTKDLASIVASLIERARTIVIVPNELFEDAAQKIELEVEAGDIKAAMQSCVDVRDMFLVQGLGWEIRRLMNVVERAVDWRDIKWNNERAFHMFVRQNAELQTELGLVEESESLAAKYERVVETGTVHFIAWCMSRCRALWLQGANQDAVVWAERGRRIKKETDIDTDVDIDQNYYLAIRDGGDPERAFDYFGRGVGVEKLLGEESPIKQSYPSLGNVGRCLQLMGKYEEALVFYIQAAKAIIVEERIPLTEENRGFAALWIGECCTHLGFPYLAQCSFEVCREAWSERMPVKLRDLLRREDELGRAFAWINGIDVVDAKKKFEWLIENAGEVREPQKIVDVFTDAERQLGVSAT